MAESKSELSQEQRVLAARARALATPRRLRDEGSERREVILFAAGTERYGIEIGVVQEVRPLEGAFFGSRAPRPSSSALSTSAAASTL